MSPPGTRAPRAVPAAAHHDLESLGGRVAQRPRARRRRTTRGRSTVGLADAGVEAAGRVPVRIAGCDDGAGNEFFQRRDSHAVTLTATADIRYSQPLRLKTRYSVTLVAAMRPSAIG